MGSNVGKNEVRWFVAMNPELKRQLSIAAIEMDMTLKEVSHEALHDWLKKYGREVPGERKLEAIA